MDFSTYINPSALRQFLSVRGTISSTPLGNEVYCGRKPLHFSQFLPPKRSPAMLLSQPGPTTFTVMVSVWMEGIFYGMNTVVYFTCLCVIISRKALQDRKLNKGLLALSTLLFASATAHMALNLQRLIEGYIISPTKVAMDEYFGDIKQPLSVAHEFLIVTTYFFSDLVIVCSLQSLSSAFKIIQCA